MIGVFFIATVWGRNNGGINSINYALLKSFSKIVSSEWKVYCVLTQEKADSDLIDEVESNSGIILINTKTPSTSRNIRRIISEKNFEQLFFIGHDIITGEYANKLRSAYENSMSILFHHMHYGSYYYLREDNPAKIREKENLQKSIIPYANIVVSIGPLLKESAHDLCIDERRDGETEIHELIPGLEDITPIEKIHKNHTVILFGRLEDKNNCIKQIELAVDALATYMQKENNLGIPTIKCYGYADDSQVNQRKLQSEVSSIAGKAISITANGYITGEEELHEILATASLCIMPSVYEGFGLTGYEAIAAGVPVIISKNTGLYKFLESWNGTPISGLYTGINVRGNSSGNGKTYTEDDLNELVACINDIFQNYEKYKKNALLLRKNLLDGHCTWDYAARTLYSIIEKEIKPNYAMLKPFQIRISEKKRIGFNEYINDFLIPEFCNAFCDKKEFVLKIIKYSNERSRRFTIFSSDEISHQEDKMLRVRLINDGTVGILNNIYSMKKVVFPIVISNFVYGKCFLLAEGSHFEQIETGNTGVPDHHVLAIIVAPLLYNDDLVGAISLDIYDKRLASQLSDEYIDFMENKIYSNVRHLTRLLAYHFYHEIRDELKFSEVKEMISNRELVSFSGKCPLNCKHCFTKEIVKDSEVENEIEDIIGQLSGKVFDVVYVSHYKENFYNPEKGIRLCEEIYKVYQCDICVTTRCTFSGGLLARIKELNDKMRMNGNNLTFCISVPAYESYAKLEDKTLIPTPQQRIDFAGQLKNMGVTSMVTVRPLFPANYIPTDEIHKIIDSCEGKVDAILTGGACVSERILKDLGVEKETFTYDKKEKSEYLVGVEKEFDAVNVESELKDLESYCELKRIRFFRHSMEALNFFAV